jgi:hypothetical protein
MRSLRASLPFREPDLTLVDTLVDATRAIRGERGQPMEQPTTGWRFAERARTAPQAEASTGLGAVQSFVEIGELRRLLARLATVELLQLLVSETFP